MRRTTNTVAERRKYLVRSVADAKQITLAWLERIQLRNALTLGLPEVDDRYHIWRVPLRRHRRESIGELVIDAFTTEILHDKSTDPCVLEARLLRKAECDIHGANPSTRGRYDISPLRNTVGLGDAADLLEQMPDESVDLVFTSPPYFNARPQYTEYEAYEEYLSCLRKIFRRCVRVLHEGRFFVINSAPVLLRRSTRNEASKRIAVPFDLHKIITEEGCEFVDDIIWVKPEGAGWATGRGRRFAADRNPMQYKAVPVTEYVMVYRKTSDKLIDWFIRNHPDRKVVERSRIPDGYEKTNLWRINPATNSKHPAPFPLELAEKVIRYYSFENDVVLDPFAGSGTTGAACAKLKRRFVLFEINEEYIKLIKASVESWLYKDADHILWLGTEPAPAASSLI